MAAEDISLKNNGDILWKIKTYRLTGKNLSKS
jgi:hypothetical protein